jgi:MerR family mercuric resistance operon transcriptional regulator
MSDRGPAVTIGAVSKTTGCQVETIRFYERIGLLPRPPRSGGGYRLYGGVHVRRLTFIRRARALGFSLREVRTMLRLADERERPCEEVRVIATAHLREVRAKITDLQVMERVLRATVARCARGIGADCPLIEALSGAGPGVGGTPPARASSPVRALPPPGGLRQEPEGVPRAPGPAGRRRRHPRLAPS